MGQALTFPHYLQQTLEQGILTPEQVWRLEYDLEQLTLEPWSPGVQEINRTVTLFHLPLDLMRAQ